MSNAQAGRRRQSLHGILIGPEHAREFLIEWLKLRVDQSQFTERHVEQSPVHRIEIGTRAERVTELIGVARRR